MNIIEKDKWNKTKFQDVVININKSVKDPLALGINKSIGLENINPNNLKIQRFTDIEKEGTKFSKLFKKDQFLFGSRRAYLRQMALADFDGVCTANIMVFDIKDPNKMIHGYLSMIIQSDLFVDYASRTSVGSLFPNAKWSSLANFNFPLPPLEEQKQIASLFQSIETAMEQVDGQEKNLKSLWLRLINDFVSDNPSFGNLIKEKKLQTVNYSDVTKKIMRRISPESYGIEKIIGGEHLNAEDFKIRTWDTVGIDPLGPAFHVLFQPGDILYGSRRTYLKKVAFAEFEGVCANTTYVIRANEELLLQDLLKHIMLSERFTQYSIGVSKGSTNPYINWKDLDNFSFQIPDIETQKEIVKVLDSIIEIREQLKQQKATLKNLKQKLLNEILG